MNLTPKKTYNSFKMAYGSRFESFKENIKSRPFLNFIVLLVLLFIIVVIGNTLRKTPTQKPVEATQPKVVQMYTLGATPTLHFQAKIEKSGTIKIVAQTAGVVQKIWRTENMHVSRGTQLISLSTNYQGGNVSTLNRQLAQRNNQFLTENYAAQVDTLNKQRHIAQKADTQASQLRSITRESFDETTALINADQAILDGLSTQIQAAGSNTAVTLPLQQAQAGTLAAINGARASLRTNQYLADDTKEPAQISREQRDITLKQLDLQQHTLDLNKDLSDLNVRIAQVNESLLYPSAPCPGVIERVYVHVGQSVNPGTVLAVVRGDMNTATAVVSVPSAIAETISRIEPSTLTIADKKVTLLPHSISQEPTEGTLNSVLFSIPESLSASLAEGSYVSVEVPVGSKTTAQQKFIPLDAVYQTQDTSSVFVAENNKAKSKTVSLGSVYGQYVQVLSGLQAGETIIVNRNVVDGDVVQAQ